MIKLIDKNRLRDDAEDAIIELLKAYSRIDPAKPVDEDLATIAKEAKTYVEGVDKKIVKRILETMPYYVYSKGDEGIRQLTPKDLLKICEDMKALAKKGKVPKKERDGFAKEFNIAATLNKKNKKKKVKKPGKKKNKKL